MVKKIFDIIYKFMRNKYQEFFIFYKKDMIHLYEINIYFIIN